MRTYFCTVLAVMAAAGSAVGDVVLVRDTFAYMDVLKDIAGSAPNSANVPGGQWVAIADNAYTQPSINGSRTSHWAKNAASLDGQSSMVISLADQNFGRLRISADIAISADSPDAWAGLGFTSVMPGEPARQGGRNRNRRQGEPAATARGATADRTQWFYPNTQSAAGFQGLVVNRSGKIALFTNPNAGEEHLGVPPLAARKFYNLSFDIDTVSGGIFNIRFDGKNVGSFNTRIFNEDAVRNAGFFILPGSRGAVGNFTVTAIEGDREPVVESAGWDFDATGTRVVLRGVMGAGNTAGIYAQWGESVRTLTNSLFVAQTYEGDFRATLGGLDHSKTYFFRFMASNSVGRAYSQIDRFISPAETFKWAGKDLAGGAGMWNDAANWSPARTVFPNGAGQSVSIAAPPGMPHSVAPAVYLGQPRVTVGSLTMTPQHHIYAGAAISTNEPGQTLVFASPQGKSRLAVTGGSFGNAVINAPVVLGNDLEISAVSGLPHHGAVFRGGISGPGNIIARHGLFVLSPPHDTVYTFSTLDGTSASSFAKTGRATVTLRGGSHTTSLAGDWSDSARAVSGGGALVLDGTAFTNTTRSGRWNIFGDAGNTVSVRNGASIVNRFGDNNPIIVWPSNTFEITGAGSLLDLRFDYLTAAAGDCKFIVANGALVRRAGARIGFQHSRGCTLEITGEGTVWDGTGRGLMAGHGTGATSNLIVIADGAVAQNTWVWIGGYSYWENGGGVENRLEILRGGKLFANAGDGMEYGSAVGISGAGHTDAKTVRATGNTALVSGGGSLWEMGERDLRVGFMCGGGGVAASNTVTVTKGGVLRGAENLRIGETRDGGKSSANSVIVTEGGSLHARNIHLGSSSSVRNALVWDATASITAETLTVHPGNRLSPIIGADGITPLETTSSARFGFAGIISPVAAPGIKPGKYTILRTNRIDNNELMLDPALIRAGEWEVVVGDKEIAVVYAPK